MQLIIDITPRELAESLERLGLIDNRDDDCGDCDFCYCDDDVPPLTFNVTIKDKELADVLKKFFNAK